MIQVHKDTKFEDVTTIARVLPVSEDRAVSALDGLLTPLKKKCGDFADHIYYNGAPLREDRPLEFESPTHGKLIMFSSREHHTYQGHKSVTEKSLKNLRDHLKTELEKHGLTPTIAIPIIGHDDPRHRNLHAWGEKDQFTQEEMVQIAREILGDTPGIINLVIEPEGEEGGRLPLPLYA